MSFSNLLNKPSGTKLSLDDLLPAQLLVPVHWLLLLGKDLDVGQVVETLAVGQVICQLLRLGVKSRLDVFNYLSNVGNRLNDRIREVVAAQLGDPLQELWHD